MDSDIINNSSPQKLREFADELNRYCNTLENSMSEFILNHKKIGEHWQGPQYDQFTEKFLALQKAISAKVQELQVLRRFVLQKALELEEAQKIKV